MSPVEGITLALELVEKLGETWERVWPIICGRVPQLDASSIPDIESAYAEAKKHAIGEA